MLATDLNIFKINLSDFVTVYPHFLVLDWFIAHTKQFEQELKELIKEIEQKLNCIIRVKLDLVSIEKETIVIKYNENFITNKLFLKNFNILFQLKFINLLKALEPSAEALVKQITCTHCKAIYSLISCNIVMCNEDTQLQCPVCKERTLLDLDNSINPLLQINKIFEQIKD